MDYFVHPSAVIDPGAEIGEGTNIWHFSHIMSGASVGRFCTLGQNVFIGNKVIVGDGVKIQNNVSLYEGVVLMDDVFVGPSVVFTNVLFPRSFIDRKSAFSSTLVGKGATIGANSTIVCGNNIGHFAMIGAGAVVVDEIPDYALVVGSPAKQIGWVGISGGRLEFDENGEASDEEDGRKYQLTAEGVHMLGQI